MAFRMPGCHHGGYALYELMIQTIEDARKSSSEYHDCLIQCAVTIVRLLSSSIWFSI